MILCTYCKKSFSRREHLERHLLCHSGLKPYTCKTCQLSFARADVLKLHCITHRQAALEDQTKTDSASLRTPIACDRCAKRKTKCDQNAPCSLCAARNWPCVRRNRPRAATNQDTTQASSSSRAIPVDMESSSPSSSDTTSFPNCEAEYDGMQAAQSTSQAQSLDAGHDMFLDTDWSLDWADLDCFGFVPDAIENGTTETHLDQDVETTGFNFLFEKMDAAVAVNHTTHASLISTHEYWPVFKCCPLPSFSCPKTARSRMALLERTLQDHDGWTRWTPPWSIPGNESLTTKVSERARDKLTATTQRLLQKGLALHSPDLTLPQVSDDSALSEALVLLPTTRVLEAFLRSHALCFTGYYLSTSSSTLDLNEILSASSSSAANLPTLLMIAQGASSIASREAHILASGLLEISHARIFDLLHRDDYFPSDPVLSHAVLLFISQAAWSGDKGQMGLAIAMRSYFSAVLQSEFAPESHHGAWMDTVAGHHYDLQRWNDWTFHEKNSRLVYAWLLIDQEMALFHDCSLSVCVADIASPLPDSDLLWNARNFNDFTAAFSKENGPFTGTIVRPMSLRNLFSHFLNEGSSMRAHITPLRLRLLLLPLQAQVYQYCQLLSCYTDSGTGLVNECQAITLSSTRKRFDQIMMLCRAWHQLAEAYVLEYDTCPMMQAGLVIFHLISLNSVTNFREIEKLARSECFYDGSHENILWRHSQCLYAPAEAVYHCGQVLRLLRALPTDIRAPWWAAAVYRVALVLWTDSLIRRESTIGADWPPAAFAIDQLMPEHPKILAYLNEGQGMPCVTLRDGTLSLIDNPASVLQHFAEILDSAFATRFSDGIRAKLEALRDRS